MIFGDVTVGQSFRVSGMTRYLKTAPNKGVQILSDSSYGEEYEFDLLEEVQLVEPFEYKEP